MSFFNNICFSLIALLFSVSPVRAQQDYFVYFQTENQKPFYARVQDKVISSTSAGYLILPKMTEGEYTVSIGFPRNEYPEQTFTFTLKDNNLGFLVKQLDHGFSLYDLQSLAVLKPVSGTGTETAVAGADLAKTAPAGPEKSTVHKKDDAFASMLSMATKDPDLLKPAPVIATGDAKPLGNIKEETTAVNSSLIEMRGEEKAVATKGKEAKAAVEEDVPVKDSVTVGADRAEAESVANAAVAEETGREKRPSAENEMKRILYVNGRDGSEMVYVDGVNADTVRVFIPQSGASPEADATTAKIEKPAVAEEKKEPAYTITPTVIPEEPKKKSVITMRNSEERVEDKEAASVEEQKEPEKEKAELILLPPKVVSAVDCKSVADDKTYLKIRRKIAGEKTNEAMVDAARKFFRNTCFSTDQLRSLSYLFLQDEGRYLFFDAAYGHVSDPENFSSLQSQIHDEYYLNRFKAILQ